MACVLVGTWEIVPVYVCDHVGAKMVLSERDMLHKVAL